MISEQLVVRRVRSGQIDGEQYVDGIAVDGDEQQISGWGRYQQSVIPHCCVKPFLAVALVESGAADRYQLRDCEIALAASSQGGEQMHRTMARNWLHKLGLPESVITSGTHQPYSPEARNELARERSHSTIFHYGSIGRHLSLLSICLSNGFPVENYRDPLHPVQRYVWRCLARYFELDPEQIKPAIVELDETPCPVISLERLAAAAVRFSTRAELNFGGAEWRIQNAMMRYPEVITYPDHYSLALLDILEGKLLIKIGAHSVCMACHLPSRTGIALKVRDGSESLKFTSVLVPVLKRLDLLTSAEWKRLEPLSQQELKSYNGRTVGSISANFI